MYVLVEDQSRTRSTPNGGGLQCFKLYRWCCSRPDSTPALLEQDEARTTY